MQSIVRGSFALSFAVSILASPLAAHAARSCTLDGTYGYVYQGTSVSQGTTITLAETGTFAFDKSGSVSGTGMLTSQFADFSGTGPLWLLLRETQGGGTVTPDAANPCTGTASFVSTATVLQSSNPAVVPVGTVLFTNSPRSVAYTISGAAHQIVDLVATSPGTVAAGTAHRISP